MCFNIFQTTDIPPLYITANTTQRWTHWSTCQRFLSRDLLQRAAIIGVPVFIGCRHEHNINNITFSTVHMVDWKVWTVHGWLKSLDPEFARPLHSFCTRDLHKLFFWLLSWNSLKWCVLIPFVRTLLQILLNVEHMPTHSGFTPKSGNNLPMSTTSTTSHLVLFTWLTEKFSSGTKVDR